MPTINQLTAVDAVIASDQVPLYSSDNGDARKASISVITKYINDKYVPKSGLITQFYTPPGNAFIAIMNDSPDSVFFIISLATPLTSGTLRLPSISSLVDKQEVLLVATDAVGLTVDPNGANGVLAGINPPVVVNFSTYGFIKFRFEASSRYWFRVG